jgi:1-acyl-sn-glycerol-3-phosphate acyltransferase
MFDLKVYGTRHVPKTGGVLLLANHQSYLDPVLLGVRLDRPISYMAKSDLFEGSGFFTWLIRSLHAFPVKLGRGDVGAIKESINRLHEGYVLNIYPEGSRTLDGEIGPIQSGVALVVRRAAVPIVPVVIDGSFQAWKKGSKLFRKHPIRVMYGPPLMIEGLKGPQLVALIDRTLRDMLAELRRKK